MNLYSLAGPLYSGAGSLASHLSTPDESATSIHGHNGYRGSGFDPGEWALKIAHTSKEGSRRVTFPLDNVRGRERIYRILTFQSWVSGMKLI